MCDFGYLIELDSLPPSWVDGSDGDPGRTTRKECAKRFKTVRQARDEADRLANLFGRTFRVVSA